MKMLQALLGRIKSIFMTYFDCANVCVKHMNMEGRTFNPKKSPCVLRHFVLHEADFFLFCLGIF